MKLQQTASINLPLKPCSMTAFKQPSTSRVHYAIACYEQDSAGNYIGQIRITPADGDLKSEAKVLPMTGGVFRIYNHPGENRIFAVTTNGKVIFIDTETFEVDSLVYPVEEGGSRPYFTDGSLRPGKLAVSDDAGNVHVLDRETGQVLAKQRGHLLRKVGNLECPAWSVAWRSEEEIASVGDDGRLNLWDLRASPMAVSAFSTGPCDDGLVFVKVPKLNGDGSLITGDYGQNYCVWDLRGEPKLQRTVTKELPGGVWHVDDSLATTSHGLQAVACMQGGFVILDESLDTVAADDHSGLTYGVAIHENPAQTGLIVAEVEFDDRKLNQYSLV
uniref:WD_REPEATS_REGION domain-containing protein n=1 Tax=Panagrellus redivivus TaxID=6233 RepID=A0A7E4VG87_PANRE